MYRESRAPIVQGSITSGTAQAITLTGAAKLIITVKDHAVFALLGTATAAASTGLYIPTDTVYELYPGPNQTDLSCIGAATAASTVYIQEVI